MYFSIGEGPSWAEALTAFSTAALVVVTSVAVVAAICAGLIALRQFKLTEEIERRRLTFDLIKSYTLETAAIEPGTGRPISVSPMQAYAQLAERLEHQSGPIPRADTPTVKQAVGAVMLNYIVLRNHLDEADELYRRGMIDRDLFLSRQAISILSGVEVLRRLTGFSDTSQDDATFLSRLHTLARDYVKRHTPSDQA